MDYGELRMDLGSLFFSGKKAYHNMFNIHATRFRPVALFLRKILKNLKFNRMVAPKQVNIPIETRNTKET